MNRREFLRTLAIMGFAVVAPADILKAVQAGQAMGDDDRPVRLLRWVH